MTIQLPECAVADIQHARHGVIETLRDYQGPRDDKKMTDAVKSLLDTLGAVLPEYDEYPNERPVERDEITLGH